MKSIKSLYLVAILAMMPFSKIASQSNINHFLHTVSKGQSLYSIASMYNVTVDEIIQLNQKADERIKAGEALKIPQKANNQLSFHTIQSGETLYQLTIRYGVSAKRICQANPGLSASNFRIGQVIAIPPKLEEPVQEEPQKQVVEQAPQKESKEKSEGLKPNCRDMHKVQRKETIYSISRLYQITEEELIEANPELRTKKLKKGKFLCIPYAKGTVRKQQENKAKNEGPASNYELFQKNQKESRKFTTIKAALMLPFMADQKSNEEQTRMVEYYEGFLMALDSLKEMNVSVELNTYDTGKSVESIQNILAKEELKGMDIIFGPAYPDQVKPLAEFAKNNQIRLVVPFTSKTDEVFDNPYIYQINTPQSYLYSEVYEHFLRKFTTEYKVIFLDAGDASAKDKEVFIKGFKDELSAKGVNYKELKAEDINPDAIKLAMDSTINNIFIPTSASNTALIKIIPQLTVITREKPHYRMMLFGYPDWQTYTHDHLGSFFELDTYFYSSFYTNNLFPAAIQFTSAYRKWYSKDMANTYPKYGMLGFDTAFFFLKGMHQYGTNLEENLSKLKVNPIQTGFKFDRVNNWGGFINRKVFFVHFNKGFELIKIDFE